MSLNWTWDAGVDRDDLGWIETSNGMQVAPVTEAIIFATMAVGINKITEKSADEFIERTTAYEQAHGTFLNTVVDGDLVPRPLTVDDIRDHIGMHTNASRLNKREFAKRVHPAAVAA